jgi:hypothetical protein
MDAFARYKGYRIFAIDGTELQLPKFDETAAMCGYKRNSCSPKARFSILCDVVSGITVHAALGTLDVGERALGMKHLQWFEAHRQAGDILLFDRGYPSKRLIGHLAGKKIKFVIRLPKGFNPEADNSSKNDFHIEVKGYRVRIIKLQLPTGEIEILATNLGEDEFAASEFGALSSMRWGVETKYNTLKNKLRIEDFSGKTLVAVLQDIYATLYLSNIAAAFKIDADEVISYKQKDKELKYDYVTNENVLIGSLKDELVKMLLEESPKKRSKLFNKLIIQISRSRTAVSPGRSFKRHKNRINKCKIKQAI